MEESKKNPKETALQNETPIILEVALPVPMHRLFDYLPPESTTDVHDYQVGQRIQVPFGHPGRKSGQRGARKLIGIITAIKTESELPIKRLKHAHKILDPHALLDANFIDFLLWAANYYHYPQGLVFEAALPVWLRKKIELPSPKHEEVWFLTELGHKQLDKALFEKLEKRAPKQARLLDLLHEYHGKGLGLAQHIVAQRIPTWRDSMRRMLKHGWVSAGLQKTTDNLPLSDRAPVLSQEQSHAVSKISEAITAEHFQAFLLEGVTGSGKTEVYLAATEKALEQGKQVLCLVPEIALTPQFIQRFEQRLQTRLAVLHSGLGDRARCLAWLSSAQGEAKVILGTRSAIYTPMLKPGLIIIDEEHDTSFKQDSGFRYSARDLSLVRAKRANVPVILGSATPSIESLQHAQKGQYQHIRLTHRPNHRPLPIIKIVDLRKEPVNEGLSYPLLATMEQVLARDEQVLIFLNRRGYAPVLLCTQCMWSAQCDSCEVNFTYHHRKHRLRCHHCNKNKTVPKHCPECKHELKPIGEGTERIESFLQARFPKIPVIRIDRDTIRNKEQMQKHLNAIYAGGAKILIGTQMLTKGHDFPDVTLVGVLNADSGLFSSDFRSTERLSQQMIQVSGRAGRADKPGLVLIQSNFPEHPLLEQLKTHDYASISTEILNEREQSHWPPFSHLALLRVEAQDVNLPMQFLEHIVKRLQFVLADKVEALGPAPAPMTKRAGFFRAQLLLRSEHRASLHQVIYETQQLIYSIPESRKVRWSLDIDPSELY